MRLLEKTEDLIKRMRWKAFYFLNNDAESEVSTSEDEEPIINENFGLKSKRTPPKIDEMIDFERELFEMVENIQFQEVNDSLQSKLKEDVKKLDSSDDIFVQADKSRNMYKMDGSSYDKLLTENITQKYRIADPEITAGIDAEFNEIAAKLNISDRIDQTSIKPAFITVKDHKEQFQTNTKCRLINPSKSEMGRVSKSILDRINTSIRTKLHVNQWRSTDSVLKWFTDLNEKSKLTFLLFDIVDYYPSISEELLDKSLKWAKQFITIQETEYEAIMHSRRSLLYDNNGKTWVKRDAKKQFDVSMGAFDGAEVCELVGLYILNQLEKKLNLQSIGLYRDDGLAVLKSMSGSESDRARKELIKVFQECGLKITVETNLKTVNFLDVTFDLTSGTHKPYRKPNSEPVYINNLSNHPPSIIQNIPQAISRRISTLSSDQSIFDDAAPSYNAALKKAGYQENIKYIKKDSDNGNGRKKRKRDRKVIWYNPPYSKSVKTNVGAQFIKLIGKHFPRGHKLHKIFNRNNLKISYSCMRNMQQIIKAHNSKILKRSQSTTNKKSCNCRQKNNCPLRGNCLVNDIVYKVKITSNDSQKPACYIGLASGSFKTRYNNHNKSFRHERYEKDTELSKFIWSLKRKNVDYSIDWEILKKSNTYKRASGQCNLCMEEKLQILCNRSDHTCILINKRNELVSKCRHGNHKRKPSSRAKKK